VKPSTAYSAEVARSGGLVVVNEADTGLPSARFSARLDRSTPAFWNMSTIRSLSSRRVSAASGRRTLPPGFQITCARRLTVKTRRPSR
jgi:hypothetical protein